MGVESRFMEEVERGFMDKVERMLGEYVSTLNAAL